MSERWIGLQQLHLETGESVRNLQYIRGQEPGVLMTRQRGSTTEYRQPDCTLNLKKRAVERAKAELAPTVSLDEARTRKALAEAELAEMDVAKARGEWVSVADYETALARVLDREMARLRALPVRLSHFGPEVEAAAEVEIERMVNEMAGMDEDVIDEPVAEAKEAA